MLELKALDADVANVKELFRQLPNPTPTQRVNNDRLNGLWEDLWDLSRMYVERIKVSQFSIFRSILCRTRRDCRFWNQFWMEFSKCRTSFERMRLPWTRLTICLQLSINCAVITLNFWKWTWCFRLGFTMLLGIQMPNSLCFIFAATTNCCRCFE